MIRAAAACLAGVLLAAWAPLVLKLGVLAAMTQLSPSRRNIATLALLLVGLLRFEVALADYRTASLAVVRELDLHGVIRDVVALRDGTARFRFEVDAAEPTLGGTYLYLSWPELPISLSGGDRLHVSARGRSPRGLANPGGFDSEAWAFASGIHGLGYVTSGHALGPSMDGRARLDRLRQSISDGLRQYLGDRPAQRLLPALAVGDRSGLDDSDRQALVTTGTYHLLAISGLHVGLVAAAGVALGCVLWVFVGQGSSRRGFALAVAVIPALAYTALAGFSVSTVRALAMFLLVASAWWSRGLLAPGGGLLLAAATLAFAMPRSVAGAGYWLSFGAVAAILVAIAGVRGQGKWSQLVRIQVAILLLQRPLASVFGLGASWLGPFVNVIAIPWVGWVVVPTLLVSIVLAWASLGGAGMLDVSAWFADTFHEAMVRLAQQASGLYRVVASGWTAAAGGAGALLFLAPRALRLTLPAAILLAASTGVFRKPGATTGALDLHLLDVGQGLAVLVELDGRWLLYDAGPMSRMGWSAGEQVVLPFLHQQGVSGLDRVIISHGDADHAGGWPAIDASELELGPVWSSFPGLGVPCQGDMRWKWQETHFEILHPSSGLPYLGNDSSCVLEIRHAGQTILLPGDISAAVEARLLPLLGPVTVLVAAHHGSASSSSEAFVGRAQPTVTLMAHGFANRFGMPRPEILDRFEGLRVLSTAACGYLNLRMDADGLTLVRAERAERRQRWHDQTQDDGLQNQYDCDTRLPVGVQSERPHEARAVSHDWSDHQGVDRGKPLSLVDGA